MPQDAPQETPPEASPPQESEGPPAEAKDATSPPAEKDSESLAPPDAAETGFLTQQDFNRISRRELLKLTPAQHGWDEESRNPIKIDLSSRAAAATSEGSAVLFFCLSS
jgi:hypothetical protein